MDWEGNDYKNERTDKESYKKISLHFIQEEIFFEYSVKKKANK